MAFTSDPSTHRQCFNVTITDDLVLEDTERFLLSLVLAEGSTIPVNISPNISHVDIVDDDCKHTKLPRRNYINLVTTLYL